MRPTYSKDPLVERSLRHSVRDGVAFSVMVGGGESYFSAFALHLRASTAEVGILATLPVLVGSFSQLLSAYLGGRHNNRRTLMLTGALLQVLAWAPLAILPLFFPQWALPLLLLCLVFYFAAGHLITPQWTSLMGDLVPERRRGRYFAYRSRVSSVTSFAALVGAGALLHHFADQKAATLGFLIIFTVAASARLVSAYHMSRMHEPTPKAAVLVPPQVALALFARAPFRRFSLFFALMQFSVGVAAPFFSVFMLRELDFSYLQYMTLIATSVLFQFLTLSTWGRISDAFGNRLVLLCTGFMIALLPALWLFHHGFWYLVAVQAFSGLVWGGFTLAAGNFCFDLIPADVRPTWMAVHNVLSNIGLFLGALSGGWLGQVLPTDIETGYGMFQLSSVLLGLFLISSLLRLSVAALFLPRLQEVRVLRPFSWGRLAFRVTRSPAVLRALRPTRRKARQPALAGAPAVNTAEA